MSDDCTSALAAQQEQIAGLFDAIAHGDDEHRAWLKQAIDDHFAGRPVERVRGTNSAALESIAASGTPAAGVWVPTHRHYKGGLYQLLHEATDEYTHRAIAVYRAEDGRIWTRAKHAFNEIMPDGTPRFAPIAAKP
jgi:hypothetical protein